MQCSADEGIRQLGSHILHSCGSFSAVREVSWQWCELKSILLGCSVVEAIVQILVELLDGCWNSDDRLSSTSPLWIRDTICKSCPVFCYFSMDSGTKDTADQHVAELKTSWVSKLVATKLSSLL